MTITVDVQRDDAIRFCQPVMSDQANGIFVTQSLRCDLILVSIKGRRYRVRVVDIAAEVCSLDRAVTEAQ